jgi:putative acetyltransferase
MPVIIRPEEPRDYAGVAAVVEAAFGQPDEARLVEALRRAGHAAPELTLIAEVDGEIVGHVMQSYVTLRGDEDRRVLALAPLAVTPARQRDGIGGALMRETIRLADERGEPLIVLLGHPVYYPRFGFENARELGVEPPTPAFPDAAFMVRKLAAYDERYRGTVAYPPEWGIE